MVDVTRDGKVVFEVRIPGAKRVEIVGTLRGWHEERIPMQKLRRGRWQATLDLPPGNVLFRYLVDGTRWAIDRQAHGVCRGSDGIERSRVWRADQRAA